MACSDNGKNTLRRPGTASETDDILIGLGQPTWKNVLLWLTFFLAVMSYLKR